MDKWIDANNVKPNCHVNVLMCLPRYNGKGLYITIGKYIPPRTMRPDDFLDSDLDGLIEKVEEDDWVIESFWELLNCNRPEFDYNYIGMKVTHWMPLPEIPF